MRPSKPDPCAALAEIQALCAAAQEQLQQHSYADLVRRLALIERLANPSPAAHGG